MEKLDKKNINKSVISVVNQAMDFKINAIIEDDNSDYDDPYSMCCSINNQANCCIEELLKDLTEKKELYKVFFTDYVENPSILHEKLIYETLKSNTEFFIHSKEKEIFKMIKEKVRQKEEEEIQRYKFKKVAI
jgi:CRISPR/Cas system endoribonuclease Cas6 (RAMP superfamily)